MPQDCARHVRIMKDARIHFDGCALKIVAILVFSLKLARMLASLVEALLCFVARSSYWAPVVTQFLQTKKYESENCFVCYKGKRLKLLK